MELWGAFERFSERFDVQAAEGVIESLREQVEGYRQGEQEYKATVLQLQAGIERLSTEVRQAGAARAAEAAAAGRGAAELRAVQEEAVERARREAAAAGEQAKLVAVGAFQQKVERLQRQVEGLEGEAVAQLREQEVAARRQLNESASGQQVTQQNTEHASVQWPELPRIRRCNNNGLSGPPQAAHAAELRMLQQVRHEHSLGPCRNRTARITSECGQSEA